MFTETRDNNHRERPQSAAEDELAHVKHQNELILEAAGEGIYGLDCEGKTTFLNPAAAHMLGFDANALLGQPMHALLHHTRSDGSPFPKEECPIYAAFKDGAVHHVDDEVFWRKDGNSFPVDYTSTPIHENGKLTGAVVVFKDITDRKQAEKELHKAYAEVERMKERLEAENVYLQEEIKVELNHTGIIGQSNAIQQVLHQVVMLIVYRIHQDCFAFFVPGFYICPFIQKVFTDLEVAHHGSHIESCATLRGFKIYISPCLYQNINYLKIIYIYRCYQGGMTFVVLIIYVRITL